MRGYLLRLARRPAATDDFGFARLRGFADEPLDAGLDPIVFLTAAGFFAGTRFAGFFAAVRREMRVFVAVAGFLLVAPERDGAAFWLVPSKAASRPPSSATAASTESTTSEVRALLKPNRFAKAVTNSSFIIWPFRFDRL